MIYTVFLIEIEIRNVAFIGKSHNHFVIIIAIAISMLL